MRSRHKVVGIGAIVFLLLLLSVLQLQAQNPTPESPTATSESTTSVSASAAATSDSEPLLSGRQAVVRRAVDGDSIAITFIDDGTAATIHLANVDAPEFSDRVECFGRESFEFVTQTFRDNPLVSVSLAGDVQDNEAFGYVELPDRTLVNRLLVLFGYGKFSDQIKSAFAADIKNAEEQSKLGKAGLWRVCDTTQQPPSPCFLFSRGGVDPASSRAFFIKHPDADEIRANFLNVAYDPVRNELMVMWELSVNALLSGWRMKEFYRLSDCNRDRSESFNHRDSR